MFHQEQDDPPEWVVQDVGNAGGVFATREVVAMELFAGALPSHWEVTGVEVRIWDFHRRYSRLVVGGRFRTRPRGAWEVVPIPFIHIWSVAGEQVEAVFDYLAGIEVRRRGTQRTGRRILWWRRPDDTRAAG